MREPKKLVVIGILGTTLDAGRGPKKWRPSIDLAGQKALQIARFELLHTPGYQSLARDIMQRMTEANDRLTVRLQTVEWEDAWDFEHVYNALASFIREYPFQPDREEYLVHITTGSHVIQICLFLLIESREIPGKLIQTSPPSAQATHGSYTIIDLELAKYDQIAKRFRQKKQDNISILKLGIATRNEHFNQTIEQIERVTVRSKAPILLHGPTGTGKTSLAKRMYELKKKHHQLSGALVEINCATLRNDSAMSTLFGHSKGAFTGATEPRTGLLRKAHEGLLFLDEIGELGLDEQAMLLRAIEEKEFYPLGSDKMVSSNFQLVLGTCQNLQSLVKNGRFRDDLLARIQVWTFRLPGLTERREDIEPNLDFELQVVGQESGQLLTMSKEARAEYINFAVSKEALWTGNFRDLGASVRRMATLADGGRIVRTDVREELGRLRTLWSDTTLAEPNTTNQLTHADTTERLIGSQLSALDRFDLVQLRDVLNVCLQSSSLSDAGRTLFACSRKEKSSTNDGDRLRKYLAKFGITWSHIEAQNSIISEDIKQP